jgi:hypothetical protein
LRIFYSAFAVAGSLFACLERFFFLADLERMLFLPQLHPPPNLKSAVRSQKILLFLERRLPVEKIMAILEELVNRKEMRFVTKKILIV